MYIFANTISILAKSLTIQSMCICLNVKDCFSSRFSKKSPGKLLQLYTSVFLNHKADVSISKKFDNSCICRFELSGGNYPKLILFGDSYLVGICVVPIFQELVF